MSLATTRFPAFALLVGLPLAQALACGSPDRKFDSDSEGGSSTTSGGVTGKGDGGRGGVSSGGRGGGNSGGNVGQGGGAGSGMGGEAGAATGGVGSGGDPSAGAAGEDLGGAAGAAGTPGGGGAGGTGGGGGTGGKAPTTGGNTGTGGTPVTGGAAGAGGVGGEGGQGGPTCGNGKSEPGETCDDGNTVTEKCAYGQTSCMVCGAGCQTLPGATSYCGDGTRDNANAEGCDDSNTVTEKCPYGQTAACTVCNNTCKSVAGVNTYCGDGVRDTANGEGCDDSNTVTEKCAYGQTMCNVCDSTCKSVAGVTSYCGDGARDLGNGENCDDANSSNLDTCSTTCKSCSLLPGMTPTGNIANPTYFHNSGMAFTATSNATLHQFSVYHQGKADTITLATQAGAVLANIALPAAAANPFVVTGSWTLTSGVAYRVSLATAGNNGMYIAAPTGTYPVAVGAIRIDSSWLPDLPANNMVNWLTFNNFRSCLR